MSLTQAESALVAEMARVLPPGAVWVDGGGGVGDWTALVVSWRPQATVWVFEPQPANAQRCRERLGMYAGVTVVEAALTDQMGPVVLYSEGGLGSSLVRAWWPPVPVETARLCDLDRIDVLKLDVEGAEPAALRALGSHRPRVIQYEIGGTWVEPTRETARMLEAMGYTVEPHDPDGSANVVARGRR